MEDKKIKCIDCHKDFIFTAGEQQFFKENDSASLFEERTAEIKERPKKEATAVDVIEYWRFPCPRVEYFPSAWIVHLY